MLQIARPSCLAFLLFALACSGNSSMPKKSTVADPACEPYVLPPQPDVEPPRPIQKPTPRAPLKGNFHGYVCLQATVDTEGRVVGVDVVATDNKEFSDSVLGTLSKWRYQPAMRGGVAVETRISLSFSFMRDRR